MKPLDFLPLSDGATGSSDYHDLTVDKTDRVAAHISHTGAANIGRTSSKSSRKSSILKTKNALLGDKHDGQNGGAGRDVSMEDMLEKIRRNRGDKQVWTQQKIRDLVKSR